jgi:hypothetical protein
MDIKFISNLQSVDGDIPGAGEREREAGSAMAELFIARSVLLLLNFVYSLVDAHYQNFPRG